MLYDVHLPSLRSYQNHRHLVPAAGSGFGLAIPARTEGAPSFGTFGERPVLSEAKGVESEY